MTAVVSIILGTGLPASASYLLVAIGLAPLLVKLGVSLLPAHLFVFCFANFSYLTPPVAIAALFGAQLAGAPYMRTAIESAKVGVAGFVLPFMILWSPAFLGDYSNPVVYVIGLLVCILVFIGLQAGFVGYLLTKLNPAERILVLAGPVLLMLYLFTKNILWLTVGAGLLAVGLLCQVVKKRRAQIASRGKPSGKRRSLMALSC